MSHHALCPPRARPEPERQLELFDSDLCTCQAVLQSSLVSTARGVCAARGSFLLTALASHATPHGAGPSGRLLSAPAPRICSHGACAVAELAVRGGESFAKKPVRKVAGSGPVHPVLSPQPRPQLELGQSLFSCCLSSAACS